MKGILIALLLALAISAQAANHEALARQLRTLPPGKTAPGRVNSLVLRLVALDPGNANKYLKIASRKFPPALARSATARLSKRVADKVREIGYLDELSAEDRRNLVAGIRQTASQTGSQGAAGSVTLSGTGTIAGGVSLNGGGTLDLGGSNTLSGATLISDGSFTLASGGILTLAFTDYGAIYTTGGSLTLVPIGPVFTISNLADLIGPSTTFYGPLKVFIEDLAYFELLPGTELIWPQTDGSWSLDELELLVAEAGGTFSRENAPDPDDGQP